MFVTAELWMQESAATQYFRKSVQYGRRVPLSRKCQNHADSFAGRDHRGYNGVVSIAPSSYGPSSRFLSLHWPGRRAGRRVRKFQLRLVSQQPAARPTDARMAPRTLFAAIPERIQWLRVVASTVPS
jgi:hypothetical protein